MVKHIIWIQTAFIGDIVLTTAVMEFLNRTLPEVSQYLITTKAGQSFLKEMPFLKKIIFIEKKFFQDLKKTKKEFFKLNREDTVILRVHKSYRSALIAYFLNIKTISYEEASLSFLSQETVLRIAALNEVLRIGLLLEPLGIRREELLSIKAGWLKKTLQGGDFGETTQLVPQKEYGVIAPGSVWPTKKWPYYKELIQSLLAHTDLDWIIVGGKDDFIDLEKHPRIKNKCGTTTLFELMECLAHAKILIGNDSAPCHFASAFNIPTCLFFGPTTSGMGFAPMASTQLILEDDALECRPCDNHGPKACPLGHFKCMKSMVIEKVLSRILGWISNSGVASS